MHLVDEPGTKRLFVHAMQGPIFSVSYDGKTVIRYLDANDAAWGVPIQFSSRDRGFQGFDATGELRQRSAHCMLIGWRRFARHGAEQIFGVGLAAELNRRFVHLRLTGDVWQQSRSAAGEQDKQTRRKRIECSRVADPLFTECTTRHQHRVV